MQKVLKGILILIFLGGSLAAQEVRGPGADMKWWKDAKFGMFVHWGLYSVTAGEWKGKPSKGNEHFMLYERIPVKEYAKIADDFNPVKFNADAWVKRAKDAGMKYVVFTSKHHDGYAMYDSKASDYNIGKTTKWHRDPIKELAAACKKYGLRLGLYYSLGRDWEDPDVPTNWPEKAGRSNTWDFPNEDGKVFARYFERKVKPQIKELLSNYGPIGIIWFDTPELISKSESLELEQFIRGLQPNCIINSRIGNGLGDYLVSEQQISATKLSKPWEACITMSGKWSYNRYDKAWKSPELLIRQLVEIVGKGGNFLLNVNPDGAGEFPEQSIQNLQSIGQWMKVNQEAIYGTQPWTVTNEVVSAATDEKQKNASGLVDTDNDNTAKTTSPDIYFTKKDRSIYVYARSWTAPNLMVKSLKAGAESIKSIQLLGAKDRIAWKQESNHLYIEMPKKLPAGIPVYVFKVDVI
ncbi:MAG: alpha-L-fucosidase [Candidatus Pedobacter colombiensis]|uniref:alpha-L-fucosidase n=1 Tax=Candidatus Pedobacter colombiensis TaxID=3121371 RepID=A0AAJ6B811_9SPHI|nr:alpha-L-fucosidase [Pedobacter sp.]WEK20041.1 MAG: alpha-L-fucosidase [Pedobacter sp.]